VTDYLGYSLVVAEVEGGVVGFAVWRGVGEGEWELLNVAVDPIARGRGVGRALVEALPAGRIFLEVRESNAGARRLYERSGFAVVGRRRGYYQAPAEDGIVMEMQK
jgi:ribosomal-protein-alanine N-acetyltransferase